jgi:hypothetical protein
MSFIQFLGKSRSESINLFLASGWAKRNYIRTVDDIAFGLKPWVDAIKKAGTGVCLNGYGYYPNKRMDTWTATDGSKIETSLAELIVEYAGENTMIDFLANFPEEATFLILAPTHNRRRMDQADFEASRL